jgi:hypothetical protein
MKKIPGDELLFVGTGDDTLLPAGVALKTSSPSKLTAEVSAPSFLGSTPAAFAFTSPETPDGVSNTFNSVTSTTYHESVFASDGGGFAANAPLALFSNIPVQNQSGPDSTVSVASTTGFTINLKYDAAASAPGAASFRAGIQQAANLLMASITDKITVNLIIHYSGTGGGAFASPDASVFDTYSQVRAFLINNATPGDHTFDALPGGSSIQGQTQVRVWNAQEKLFGQLSANDTTTDDGSATFATDINPNLLVGVALHELTHALGRVPNGPQPDIFDLFRFTSPGNRFFDGYIPPPNAAGPPAGASFFSLDGGNTRLADYGEWSDPSDFLNPANSTNLPSPHSNLTPNDPFNEQYGSGTLQQLTAVDLKQLDALGFHISVPDTTSPSLVHDGSVTLAVGATATIPSSQLQFDDNVSTHAQEAYTVVTGPTHGTLLKSGSATSSFTQADIDNGLISYHEDGTVVSADSFTFKVTDAAGNASSTAAFQINVNHGPLFAQPTTQLSAFAPGAGGWTDQDHYPRELADVNGDKMADIVGFGKGGVSVSLATGNGHFAAPTNEIGSFGAGAGGWTDQDQYPRLLADVNGDKMADIVGFGRGGVNVSLATGGGHFAAPTNEIGSFGVGAGGWTDEDQYPRFLADVNGDKMADIVGFGRGGVSVSLATGGGHFAAPTNEIGNFGVGAGGWTSEDQYPRLLADVNGDGMADIVGFGRGGVNVSLATGGGHFAAPSNEIGSFGVGAGGWTSQDQYPRLLADVNGDGMADIVGFGRGGVSVSLATGNGHFATPTNEIGSFGVGAGGWTSQDQYPRTLGDVNGDGAADIIGFGQGGVYEALSNGFHLI